MQLEKNYLKGKMIQKICKMDNKLDDEIDQLYEEVTYNKSMKVKNMS
jgi:hypothetical protein